MFIVVPVNYNKFIIMKYKVTLPHKMAVENKI